MKRTLMTLGILALLAAAGCKREQAPANAPATGGGGGGAATPAAPTGGGAGPAAPTGGGAAPAAPSGGNACDHYQRCCTALSAMPNMGAMAASCANIATLRGMGAAADSACDQARQGLGQLPNAPAECH